MIFYFLLDILYKKLLKRTFIKFLLHRGNDDLDTKFLSESKNAGLLALKGHRSVGGMRASIYNGLPEEAVEALIEFMDDFEKKNS